MEMQRITTLWVQLLSHPGLLVKNMYEIISHSYGIIDNIHHHTFPNCTEWRLSL